MPPSTPMLPKDWPAFGAALLIGLFECAALARSRAADALRAGWARLTHR